MKPSQRATAWSLALACASIVLLSTAPAQAEVKSVGDGTAAKNWQPFVIIDPITGLPAGLTVTGGGTTVRATAAPPSYAEGSTTNQISTDLAGNIRITGTINSASVVKATAADPSYTEGSTSNPVSTDLAGYARSLAKQFGTWNVGLTGTLPAFAATPTFNLGTLNGAALASNQATELTQIGGLTETAPASDTASSGLNGRLQRVAQDITTLSGLITTLNGKIDTLNTNVTDGSAVSAVKIDHTTPGTTDAVVASVPAATTGGAGSGTFEVAASDNHQVLKNGAGTLYTISGFSKHTAALFIRLYDAGTGFNGCNSATGLIWEGQIPNPGFVFSYGLPGRAFTTGLSVCVTGAYGNTDTTVATASVASVNVGFK